jgi:[ribosomal protein S18]-alanine N-acetyltransferase
VTVPPAAPATVTLRRGRRRDLEALTAIERNFFGSDHRISRQSFRRFIASSKSTLIVAEVGGTLAGCALVNYRIDSRLGRLYTIAVAAEFQRRGIARRLLAAAEKSARGRGCRAMRLEVREDDPGAIALYESSGYIRIGRRKRYYGGEVDALRFEKPLDRPPNPPDLRARIGFDGGHRGRRSRQSSRFRL